MRRTWRKAKPKIEKKFRSNAQIRVPVVFLIDENGENVGEMPLREALARAEAVELDLVEVNPKPDVPVCKIMDYGQFKYEQDKKAHKQKVAQKKVDTKGVRLSVRISQHDYDMRVAQGLKFLQKGHKLKIELILKGRERQHMAKAAEIIRTFVADLSKAEGMNIISEQDLTKQGARFIMVVVNKKG